MGSAAAAPQPHGAGESRGSETAGHILGPGAAHLSAPGPENGPDPGRQYKKKKKRQAGRREGGREDRGREREGKGKGRQEPEACRRPSLERTASGWNQNTPSLSPARRHPRAAAVRFASPRRRSPERKAGFRAGRRVRGCCLRPPALFQLTSDGRWRFATSGQRNLGFGRRHPSRTRPSGRTRK